MSAFDLFVLSSHTEGTPMVLLEAMHARVPIVATRVGGIPDLLDSTSALLVDSDSPAALADQSVARWATRYMTAYRAALAAAG